MHHSLDLPAPYQIMASVTVSLEMCSSADERSTLCQAYPALELANCVPVYAVPHKQGQALTETMSSARVSPY